MGKTNGAYNDVADPDIHKDSKQMDGNIHRKSGAEKGTVSKHAHAHTHERNRAQEMRKNVMDFVRIAKFINKRKSISTDEEEVDHWLSEAGVIGSLPAIRQRRRKSIRRKRCSSESATTDVLSEKIINRTAGLFFPKEKKGGKVVSGRDGGEMKLGRDRGDKCDVNDGQKQICDRSDNAERTNLSEHCDVDDKTKISDQSDADDMYELSEQSQTCDNTEPLSGQGDVTDGSAQGQICDENNNNLDKTSSQDELISERLGQLVPSCREVGPLDHWSAWDRLASPLLARDHGDWLEAGQIICKRCGCTVNVREKYSNSRLSSHISGTREGEKHGSSVVKDGDKDGGSVVKPCLCSVGAWDLSSSMWDWVYPTEDVCSGDAPGPGDYRINSVLDVWGSSSSSSSSSSLSSLSSSSSQTSLPPLASSVTPPASPKLSSSSPSKWQMLISSLSPRKLSPMKASSSSPPPAPSSSSSPSSSSPSSSSLSSSSPSSSSSSTPPPPAPPSSPPTPPKATTTAAVPNTDNRSRRSSTSSVPGFSHSTGFWFIEID